MIHLSWNCHGLGRTMTKTALKELIFKYHPNIVFLSETRLKNDKVSEIRRKCNFPFGITVKPVKTGGGLALWWDHSVVVQVLSKSKNLIDTIIKFKAYGSHIRISWFYGPPKKEFKTAFWNSITNLAGSIDLPWLCAGDFNEHLWPYEKEGGKPWDPGKHRFLREFMDTNDLIDVPFKGQRFTWSNNWPGDGLIMIRLDRGVVNTQWLERWPSMCVLHSPMIGSDHCPLIFESDPPFEKGPKSFKFEPMWVEDPECHEVIDKPGVFLLMVCMLINGEKKLNVIAQLYLNGAGINLHTIEGQYTRTWSNSNFFKMSRPLSPELNVSPSQQKFWSYGTKKKNIGHKDQGLNG
ncbi:hypothetical protein M0R45_036169 [Rubus argutus]|uniref:Endonuclease/exonuclease/phosphatase domain-containing protein n=1 Tax=Rubus argutus TaxID=59490 RepID=A0AAW1VXY5_RUBAR